MIHHLKDTKKHLHSVHLPLWVNEKLHESSFMKFGFEIISIRIFENEPGYVCSAIMQAYIGGGDV